MVIPQLQSLLSILDQIQPRFWLKSNCPIDRSIYRLKRSAKTFQRKNKTSLLFFLVKNGKNTLLPSNESKTRMNLPNWKIIYPMRLKKQQHPRKFAANYSTTILLIKVYFSFQSWNFWIDAENFLSFNNYHRLEANQTENSSKIHRKYVKFIFVPMNIKKTNF